MAEYDMEPIQVVAWEWIGHDGGAGVLVLEMDLVVPAVELVQMDKHVQILEKHRRGIWKRDQNYTLMDHVHYSLRTHLS